MKPAEDREHRQRLDERARATRELVRRAHRRRDRRADRADAWHDRPHRRRAAAPPIERHSSTGWPAAVAASAIVRSWPSSSPSIFTFTLQKPPGLVSATSVVARPPTLTVADGARTPGQTATMSLLTLALPQYSVLSSPVTETRSWRPDACFLTVGLPASGTGTTAKRSTPPEPSVSFTIDPGQKRFIASSLSLHAGSVGCVPPVVLNLTAFNAAFATAAIRDNLSEKMPVAEAVDGVGAIIVNVSWSRGDEVGSARQVPTPARLITWPSSLGSLIVVSPVGSPPMR